MTLPAQPARPRLLRGLFCLCLVSSTAALRAQPIDEDRPITLSPFEVSTDQDMGYLAGNTMAGSRLNTALKDTPATISVLTSEFLSDIGAFQLEEALRYAVSVENEYDDFRTAYNEFATFQNYQTYRIRGLPTDVTRNYFTWNGRAIPDESAFVDRIEDSRGPNSVLFGIASPGGIINVNTKQALPGRELRQISGMYGSHDTRRVAFDINQPFIEDKFAARLIGVYNRNNSFRRFAFEEHQRALLTTKYRLTDRSRIRVDFEGGKFESNIPRRFNLNNNYLKWNDTGRQTFSDAPTADQRTAFGLSTAPNQSLVTYISNNDSAISMRGTLLTTNDVPVGQEGRVAENGGVITDLTKTDRSINVGGPSADRFSRYSILTAFFEHQFGDVTFLEIAYNRLNMSIDSRDPRGGEALRGDANAFLLDGSPNPFAGQLYLQTNWFRTVRDDDMDVLRATLSTEFDAGRWGHYRLGILGEVEDSFIGSTTMREFWIDSATGLPAFNVNVPNNAQNRTNRRTYVTEGDWGSYFVDGPVGSAGGFVDSVTDPVTGRTLSTTWYNQNFPNFFDYAKKMGMAVAQARYFDGKLILAAGIRRDDIEETRRPRWRDPQTNFQEIAPSNEDALAGQEEVVTRNLGTTKSFGLVYHLTPTVSLYYNRADNLAIPAKGQFRLPPSGEPGEPLPVPAPEGVGEDFGIGVELLDGRIYGKVVYYTTDAQDQSTTSPGAMRQANLQIMDALLTEGLITQAEHDTRTDVGSHGLFDHTSDGWEVQVTANPTENWRFQLNYSLTDAVEDNKFTEWANWADLTTQFLQQFDQTIVTERGNTISEEIGLYQEELKSQLEPAGIGKLGTRKHKYSAVTRYNFDSGWLRGAYIGGAYRYHSKMFTGVDENFQPIYGNSFWQADAFAGYRMRLANDRQLTFQLNVFNVFDNTTPLAFRFDQFGAPFRHIIQSPRTWRFTTTFEF